MDSDFLKEDDERSVRGRVFGGRRPTPGGRMIDRGWVPPDRVTAPLRFEELRQLIALYGEYNGFNVESIQKANEELLLKLKTRPRGIDQTEKILLGGPGGARGYDRDVRYEPEASRRDGSWSTPEDCEAHRWI